MIRSINLSLSNRCNAKCIWCPTTRGTKYNSDMPFDLVKKIIDEASSEDFPDGLEYVCLSENGEAIYNKDFLDICRYIRKKLPKVKIDLMSNFGMMTEELSASIIKEKLIDQITINIDGHNDKTYRSVKKISFTSITRNFRKFIELRKKYFPELDVRINCLTSFEYTLTVNAVLGNLPEQVKDNIPYSDASLVKKELSKFMDFDNDSHAGFVESKSGFWAERESVKRYQARTGIKNEDLECPMLDRVKSDIFVAPNGNWYPCCLDDNNDISLGNINTNSILELFNSEKRKDFINKLENKKFDEIGYPCNTVLACQAMSIEKKDFDKLAMKYKMAGGIIKIKQIV